MSIIARLKQEAIRRLCPELADLRQQIDQARRLASEAQVRFRRAEEMALGFMSGGTLDTWRTLQAERDRLAAELARAKADLDERHGPLLGPLAMERDQLRARVAELEALNQRMSLDYQKAICIAAKG